MAAGASTLYSIRAIPRVLCKLNTAVSKNSANNE